MAASESPPERSPEKADQPDAGSLPAMAMPDLNERLAALTTVSRAVAAQSGVTHSAALDAVYAAAKSNMPNLVLHLAAIDLPEPLLSDALITAGLNAPFMHSPTYALPEPRPVTDESERRAREGEIRRRRLVDACDILSELEQAIRQLIEEKLRDRHEDHWWKRGVPETIRRRCEERKQAKEGPNDAPYDPLAYAYSDDYRAIVTRADNWRASFGAVFGDKPEFEVCMRWAGRVRDPIAHSRPISDQEYGAFVAAANVLRTAILRSRGSSGK